MSRYQDSDDILEIVRKVARRVATLEKANPLNYGTIDEGGLIIKSGGSLSVYNSLDELNTFIGEGRVEFADSGSITGVIGEFDGMYYNNALAEWVAATMRGLAIYRPGQGDPYFTVAQNLSGSALEFLFGYDGQIGEHFGVKSESIFLAAKNSQDCIIQMQADGDILVQAAAGRTVFVEGQYFSVDAGVSGIGMASDGPVAMNGTSVAISTLGNLDITGNEVDIDATGNVDIDPGADLRFFIGTTSNAANVNMTTDIVRRVSSARKYKEDIKDAEIDPVDVLKLRPRTWIDKADLTRWENDKLARTIAKSNGEEDLLEGPEVSYPNRTIGFVAEEVAEQESLRVFVEYNKDDEPEALYYDRMMAALIPLVQTQHEEIGELKQLVSQLTTRVTALEKKVKLP